MSSKKIIELKNISKVYKLYAKPIDRLLQMLPWNRNKKYAEEFWANKNINLDIYKGEVIGVVGQNGAGKSTLLQMVCKTLEPSSGSLRVDGKIAALLELGSGFNPEFTGRENVYLAGAIAGFSKIDINKKYEAIVEFSGIGEHINNPVKTYSSGMMIRLAFAVATSVEPEILVIDEALSVGDGAFARKSFDRIMELKDSGCTILFCSHSLYQVEVLCDKVMWVDGGEVKNFGEPSEVIGEYQKFLDNLSDENEAVLGVEKEVADMHSNNVNSKTRIKKVEISNGKDKELKLVSDETDLEIEIYFIADVNLPKPTIAVVISDDQQKNITSCGSSYDKVKLETDSKGEGKISLKFPKIGLRRGKYYIHVFLMCENAIHVYDAVQSNVIQVSQKGSEVGLVSLPREWK